MMSPKEMIEVIQAFERGEKIESKLKAKPPVWTLSENPLFDFSTFDYRVAPKKKEPVKFQCWMTGSGHLCWVSSNHDVACDWKLVPSLNMTAEVEE